MAAEGFGAAGLSLGGLSVGGGVALGYALDHPGRLTGLVLVDSYGLQPPRSERTLAPMWHLIAWASVQSRLTEWTYRLSSRSDWMLRWSLRQVVRRPGRITDEFFAAVRKAAHSDLSTFLDWQRDQVRPQRVRTSYFGRLGELTVPTLLLHGESDLTVPVDHARRAAIVVPDAELVISRGSGHWVQRDDPDLAVSSINSFLAGVS